MIKDARITLDVEQIEKVQKELLQCNFDENMLQYVAKLNDCFKMGSKIHEIFED